MSRHSAAKSSYTNAHRRNAFEALTGEAPPSNLGPSSRTSRPSTANRDAYADGRDSTYASTIVPEDSISMAGARRTRSSRHSSRHRHAPELHALRTSHTREGTYTPRKFPHRDSVTGSYRQSAQDYPTRKDEGSSLRRPSRAYSYINGDDTLVERHSRAQSISDSDYVENCWRAYKHDNDNHDESDPETPRANTSRSSRLARSRAPSTSHEDAYSRSRAPSVSREDTYSQSRSHASRSNASRAAPPTSFRHTATLGSTERNSNAPSRHSNRAGSDSNSRNGRSRTGSVSVAKDPPRRPSTHYDGNYDGVSSYSGRSRAHQPSHSQFDPPSPLSPQESRYTNPEPPRSLARSASISGPGSGSSRTTTRVVNDQGLTIRRRDDGRLQWERPKNRSGESAKRQPANPPKWLLWLAGGA